MGFACGGAALRMSFATLQLLGFSLLKTIFQIIVSHLAMPDKSLQPERDDHDPQDRPPASLAPLPPRLITESIKKRLPLTRISKCRLSKILTTAPLCVVCMDGVAPEQEIRQLSNCRHVFHAECLDAWIEQGHVTCPLCRSKLLPDNGDEGGGKAEDPSHRGDPWRTERMIYLFGGDSARGTQNLFF
ncbi:hypothetical protein CDL15_Pgr023098 [Punica granatum]|uniref:RING-type domain-containing protein n=1 Tax=Punica granatum TaxID=22663 RepID=A0A218X4R7_PUNGR|nr:hypothetical protein CDL15_Pgr023098 [Punica granatum]PKI53920.1 hypothetical protein CRG98_025714 [Punica granatum]